MAESKSPTEIAIELMRLYFPLPEEEQIVVALTSFLGPRAGNEIVDLRTEMTMREVLDLAHGNEWTTAEITRMLELAGIEAFDEQFEQMTFREFVRYAAGRKGSDGTKITIDKGSEM